LIPRAVSRARAKGLWQFMYGTAKMYGLTMNSYVDERFDPIVSTHAAARHMKDLYSIFGDWGLAIAAYNCGAGNVNKAIRRSGGKRDFWDIYPYLPRETKGYVPAFVAANYVLSYYKEHHLTPKKIDMPSHVDTFMVNKMLHFEQVSEVVGIPVDELRNFNPQYIHDIIPGTERPYVLRIPYEYTTAFTDKEKEIYTYKDSIYFNPNIIKQVASRGYLPQGIEGRNKIIHRVKEGETLGGLAMKYRVNANDIRYWNGIRGNIIRTGQKLVIYSKMKQAVPEKTVASTAKPNQTQKNVNSKNAVVHVVRKGETLWSISQLYDDVTFYDLMRLNSMTKSSKIFPGDKIKVKAL
jgi:membrane-bound lytic murein transglycosylase D